MFTSLLSTLYLNFRIIRMNIHRIRVKIVIQKSFVTHTVFIHKLSGTPPPPRSSTRRKYVPSSLQQIYNKAHGLLLKSLQI